MAQNWPDLVAEGLAEKTMTKRELARRCGIAEGTLKTWLKSRRPKPEAIRLIATRLDQDPIAHFVSLGWLDVAGNPAQVHRVRQLPRLFRQLVDHKMHVSSDPRSALGVLVDDVFNQTGWECTARHIMRGSDYPVIFEDRLLLTRLDGKEISDWSWVEPTMWGLDARWSQSELDGDPPGSVAIKIPRVLAPRALGEFGRDPDRIVRTVHNENVPMSICVVGTRWSGDAKIASLLAHALGYGFSRTATAARLVYGGPFRHEPERHERIEIGRTLIQDPYGIGSRFVWSLDLRDAPDVVKTRSANRPRVIFMRPTDELIEFQIDYASRETKARRSDTKDDLISARSQVDDLMCEGDIVVHASPRPEQQSRRDHYWDNQVKTFHSLLLDHWRLADAELRFSRVIEAICL